jgi:hypothetical protein
MLKNILILIYMFNKNIVEAAAYNSWKWSGQNYENKIALPISSCDVKDIKYLRGSKNKDKDKDEIKLRELVVPL